MLFVDLLFWKGAAVAEDVREEYRWRVRRGAWRCCAQPRQFEGLASPYLSQFINNLKEFQEMNRKARAVQEVVWPWHGPRRSLVPNRAQTLTTAEGRWLHAPAIPQSPLPAKR